MKPTSRIILLLCLLLLAVAGSVAFFGVFPSGTSQASPGYLYEASGMGEKPDGSPTAGACFTYTFTAPKAQVLINNQTGADAYYVMNDTGCNAGSSYYDHVLDDGEDALWDGWLKIESLTVYISPTAGFTVAGW